MGGTRCGNEQGIDIRCDQFLSASAHIQPPCRFPRLLDARRVRIEDRHQLNLRELTPHALYLAPPHHPAARESRLDRLHDNPPFRIASAARYVPASIPPA